MKPCANERSGFSFAKKNENFDFHQFFTVLQLYEHTPDLVFSDYPKIPNPDYVHTAVKQLKIDENRNFLFLKKN